MIYEFTHLYNILTTYPVPPTPRTYITHPIMSSAYTPDAITRMRFPYDANPIRTYKFDDDSVKTVDWSQFWNVGYESADVPKNVDVFYIRGKNTVSVYAAVFVRDQDKVYYGHSVFRYGNTPADNVFGKEQRCNSRRTALVRLFYAGTNQSVHIDLSRTQRTAEYHAAADLRANGSGPYAQWLRKKENKGKTLSEYDGVMPPKPDDDVIKSGTKHINMSKYAASTVASYELALRREIHNAVCVSR